MAQFNSHRQPRHSNRTPRADRTYFPACVKSRSAEQVTTTTRATATTTFGALQGDVDGGTVVFRGIPYARPPLAELRFAPPRPPEPWAGLRDATTFGPVAMQPANPVSGRQARAGTSEDCLYLNVWTPAVDDRRRAVIVWLHGGAFTFGAGSAPIFRGAALARRGDVVVVTINYRLGIFGYLRGMDLCGDALSSTGNEGFWTSWQRCAG
jgi:para-nitrobenzyl esterase